MKRKTYLYFFKREKIYELLKDTYQCELAEVLEGSKGNLSRVFKGRCGCSKSKAIAILCVTGYLKDIPKDDYKEINKFLNQKIKYFFTKEG